MSCFSPVQKPKLTPKLELVDNVIFNFNDVEFTYAQIDSVLSTYKSGIDHNLTDSISIWLIVNVEIVTMGTVGQVKNSLRKNEFMKIIYTPK